MYEIFPSYLYLLNIQIYSEICINFDVKLVMSKGAPQITDHQNK